MYAGVGRITGRPGAVRWASTISRPRSTSGTGRTSAGATAQPNRSRCHAAHASAIAAAGPGGR